MRRGQHTPPSLPTLPSPRPQLTTTHLSQRACQAPRRPRVSPTTKGGTQTIRTETLARSHLHTPHILNNGDERRDRGGVGGGRGGVGGGREGSTLKQHEREHVNLLSLV